MGLQSQTLLFPVSQHLKNINWSILHKIPAIAWIHAIKIAWIPANNSHAIFVLLSWLASKYFNNLKLKKFLIDAIQIKVSMQI